jgi:hypothetical protein
MTKLSTPALSLLAVVLLVACSSYPQPLPEVVDNERFEVTVLGGREIPDEQYDLFYGSAVDAAGATRESLSLSIALGDRQTTVVRLAVPGADAEAMVEPLIQVARTESRYERAVVDRQLVSSTKVTFLRPADGGPVLAVFHVGSFAYWIEAQTVARVTRVLEAMPTG